MVIRLGPGLLRGEFTRSGFSGPLNYYRNHNETWELSANKPTEIHQPALFVAGERHGVIAMAGPALENMQILSKTCAPMCSYQRSGTGPNRKPGGRERLLAGLVSGIGRGWLVPGQEVNAEQGVFRSHHC